MTLPISTRFPRSERRSVLLGLRTPQVTLIAIAVICSMAAVVTTPPAGARLALLAAAVAVVVTAAVPVESMPMYRWLMLRSIHVVRRLSSQNRFRARPLKPVRQGLLHLPGPMGSLRLIRHGRGIGAVHDPHRKRITAVARIAGPAHLLQNMDEQDRRVAEYGRLIAGLCRGGRIARAQILERTLPDSGDGLATWAVQRGLDRSSPAGAIYGELLQHAAPASARHETLLGLTVDLAALAREVRKHGGGLKGAIGVLESEARTFQTSLHAAGVRGDWLTGPQLAAALRTAFDPAAVRTVDQLGGQLPAGGAGPLAVDADWDHLRTDSSYHRVYQVAEWPRIPVDPGFLSPLLLKPGVRRTFSIVMQPVPIGKALRDARRDQVERLTDRSTRSRIGQLETEQDRQVDADVAQRERDLAEGHGDVRWVGLLAVSADDLDALDDACAAIEVAASQALLDLRRLVGQQAEAFLAAALPFGTGLE